MYEKYGKRALDVVLSICGLPLLGVILLICVPFIYFEDRGPVFYNAKRLGRLGKTFRMYKLRSMIVNAPDVRNEDGSTYNGEDDPRLTSFGKFLRKTSLDEAPQLINVLKGDMSFVGPRPDLPEHYRLYVGDEVEKLNVRPGITGFNQAYYRNAIDLKERLKNDVYYVRHLSFFFDLKILVQTAIVVLKRENIYTRQH